MSGDRRVQRVLEVQTSRELTDQEYMRLYREKDLEARVQLASRMGVLDTGFYKRLMTALRVDPEIRRTMTLVACTMIYGIGVDSTLYGLIKLISHL